MSGLYWTTVRKKLRLSMIYQTVTSVMNISAKKFSIREKRNPLIDKAKGEIIVQFDDDDYYCPDYVRTMAANLANLNADLINLRGWFLYDCRSRFFGYWNLMQKEGLHYRCHRAGVTLAWSHARRSCRARSRARSSLGLTCTADRSPYERAFRFWRLRRD